MLFYYTMPTLKKQGELLELHFDWTFLVKWCIMELHVMKDKENPPETTMIMAHMGGNQQWNEVEDAFSCYNK